MIAHVDIAPASVVSSGFVEGSWGHFPTMCALSDKEKKLRNPKRAMPSGHILGPRSSRAIKK